MNQIKCKTTDEKIRAFVEKARSLIKSRGIKRDARGGWLPARQLQLIRQVLARQGFNAAIAYQASNIDRRDSKWDAAKKEVILELLKLAHSPELGLDLRTTGFLLGKINEVLKSTKEEDWR